MTEWMNQVIPLAGVITQVWVANLVAQAGQEDRRAGKGRERGPRGAASERDSRVQRKAHSICRGKICVLLNRSGQTQTWLLFLFALLCFSRVWVHPNFYFMPLQLCSLTVSSTGCNYLIVHSFFIESFYSAICVFPVCLDNRSLRVEVRKSIVSLCSFLERNDSGLHTCREFNFPFPELLHFACPGHVSETDRHIHTLTPQCLPLGSFPANDILFKKMS